MRISKLALVGVAVAVACTGSEAPDGDASSTSGGDASSTSGVRDLYEELQAGRVTLVSASGNGSSSGPSVEGQLSNETDREIRLDIHLRSPVYLTNSGRGQNMVALQVFERGGRYLSDGTRSFIALDAKGSTRVTFSALCADFERENPTSSERFTVGSVPPGLGPVLENISAHLHSNPDSNWTVAGQLALWLAQGEDLEAIRTRFDFGPADERLARSLLR